MRVFRFLPLAFISILLASVFFSCRDEGFDTDPGIELGFSADSVLFDTVFTTVGSSTQSFRVYNNHNRRINISSVSIAGGSSSNFRINVDGFSGSRIQDVEIGARDSIFVFVEVTVDPVNQNLPHIITDSIVFNVNGNQQDVKLAAWGQDAIFIRPNYTDPGGFSYHLIEQNTTWSGDLPYVVYGLAVVAPGKELTVAEGARVHFHNNASLIFLEGSSLKVRGSRDFPVVFQGDRLESFYEDKSGQWGRIWLTATSKDHEIDYAIIKNGTVGLQVDSIGSFDSPTLEISNTLISNMSIAGIVAQGSNVKGENLVISYCEQHAMILALGGSYEFLHSTFSSYSRPNAPVRQTPSVLFNNYYVDVDDNVHLRDFNHLYFGNSIIYGSLQEELMFDFLPGTNPAFTFDHCLLKTGHDVSGSSFPGVIKNLDPRFVDISLGDHRLNEESPAIDAGNPEVALQVPFDILGNERNLRVDIGAYQYYEIPEEEEKQ